MAIRVGSLGITHQVVPFMAWLWECTVTPPITINALLSVDLEDATLQQLQEIQKHLLPLPLPTMTYPKPVVIYLPDTAQYTLTTFPHQKLVIPEERWGEEGELRSLLRLCNINAEGELPGTPRSN